jgi:hypothetical protein
MGGNDSYLPATFEERGISLSFTTPQLAYCRIRKDYRDRLEVSLPNIGEGKGNYVIPWAALGQAVTLTAHDRALQEEVQRIDAMSPYDIRTAELTIAREGLAGPDVAEAATKALDADAKHIDLTNLMFMAKVIMAANAMSPEMLAGIATGKSDDMVRNAAYKAAGEIGLTPAQLDEKLGRLSKVVSPLGIEGAPESGRLRRLIADLQEFRDSLERWIGAHPNGDVELAKFSAQVAALTLDRGSGVIADFDSRARDPIKILQQWTVESEELQKDVIRLSWLFDGWEMIIRTWEQAKDEGRDAEDSALATIFRALPLLPKSEFEESETNRTSTLRISRRRSVKMYENWVTGEIDYDLLSRIEGAKARLT